LDAKSFLEAGGNEGILMERWKRNLWVLTVAQFVMRMAHTFIFPYLSLFVQELGVQSPAKIAFWAGTIALANFLGQSLLSPLWGSLADRGSVKRFMKND